MRKKITKDKRTKKGIAKGRQRRVPTSLAYPAHLNENQIIEQLRLTVEKLQIFDSIGKTLTSSLDLNEITRIIIEKLGNLIDCHHVALVLYNEETSEFQFEFPEKLAEKKQSFKTGEGILGSCVESCKAELIAKPPQTDPRYDPEIDGLVLKDAKSMIAHPILSRGTSLGILALYTDETQNIFNDQDYQLLASFADYLAIAVENAQNYKKVEQLTISDDVTKLYNWRYLNLVMKHEIARCDRYDEDLSLVFIDIDDFKQVNDSNGHLYGSQLLKEFGEFLLSQLRTSDIAIRYGGDEFILLLPRTSKENAVKTINRILGKLREHRFLKSENKSVKLTASFGISSFGDDGRTMNELIEGADKAMYMVKRGSKDSVYTASQPTSLLGTHNK